MTAPAPHQNQPTASAGPDLDTVTAVMILLHGRGATAESILQVAREFHREDVTYLAPQAAGNSWYPQSFLAPIEHNEPGLSSAFTVIRRLIDDSVTAGVTRDRVILLGFSQGACLATEFAARNAHRYGGVVGLSGGLIGPDGTPRDYDGSLQSTPVFLGCSDRDPHIPVERVHETARVFDALDGNVTKRIYPGMGHTVNRDELDAVESLLDAVRHNHS